MIPVLILAAAGFLVAGSTGLAVGVIAGAVWWAIDILFFSNR